MMDSQFNPFIRENIPPMLLNIKIKKHDDWGVCYAIFVPYPCPKNPWTEIEVEAIDVADFSITIEIDGASKRSRTLEGKGHEWFEVKIDLDPSEVIFSYKVIVSMVDFAGNELDPRYEKEIDGVFGGVLRFLEALWDFLAGAAGAIADAVAKAVNFLIEMLEKAVSGMLDAILDPLLNSPEIANFADNMLMHLEKLAQSKEGPQSDGSRLPIGRSKDGMSGLGWVPDYDVMEEEEEETENADEELKKEIRDTLDYYFKVSMAIGGIFLFAGIFITAWTSTVFPVGVALLMFHLLFLTGAYVNTLPIAAIEEGIPQDVEGIRQSLEGLSTAYGDATFIYDVIASVFGGFFASLLMGDAISLAMLAFGVSLTSMVLAAYVMTLDASNAGLCVIALAASLFAILLSGAAAFKALLAFGPSGIIVFVPILTTFLFLNLLSVTSLMGYISKEFR